MNPLITVYITNHNYGEFLTEAIESVLNQSYRHFELLIIDDGSTDNSKDILRSYENNSKIKIIYQNNKGLTISNNIALKLSKGEFIIRLDADDYFDENALKNLISAFETKEIGMVFGDWYLIDKYGAVIGRAERHNFKEDVTLYDQPAHGACTMFRKECLLKLNGYDESISRQDGYELWLRFIQKYKVSNINIPVFYYRQHSNSLTKNEKHLLNTRAKILETFAQINTEKNKKKFVSIVPIRGNEIDSRSNPFLKLHRKNLIDYTIEELIKSKNINKIIISTPSLKIIDYLKKFNNPKIVYVKRDKEIARINSTLNKTIYECINIIKDIHEYDSFVISTIEAPFKRAELIDSAINTKVIFNVDSVIGLRPFDRTLYNHNGKGMVALNNQDSRLKLERTQNYAAVPGFVVRDIKDFLRTDDITGLKIGHVLFDEEAALHINSELDLLCAKAIIRKNKKSFSDKKINK